MNLWSVAETSSVQLLQDFFGYVTEGKSKLKALKFARQEIRKTEDDHPFCWAPYILVVEAN